MHGCTSRFRCSVPPATTQHQQFGYVLCGLCKWPQLFHLHLQRLDLLLQSTPEVRVQCRGHSWQSRCHCWHRPGRRWWRRHCVRTAGGAAASSTCSVTQKAPDVLQRLVHLPGALHQSQVVDLTRPHVTNHRQRVGVSQMTCIACTWPGCAMFMSMAINKQSKLACQSWVFLDVPLSSLRLANAVSVTRQSSNTCGSDSRSIRVLLC